MRHKLAAIACSAVLFALCGAVPAARADTGNQKINFTVKNEAFELPGIALSPGSYTMKFPDPYCDYVVVTTADGKRDVGFFEVIPEWRNKRTSHVKLQFSQPTMGQLPRLDGFYYPDTKTGYEFLYPSTN
jgi:hypothetical protein